MPRPEMRPPQHLAAEVFGGDASVSMHHVPYKGASAAVAALLGEQVDLLFTSAVTVGLTSVPASCGRWPRRGLCGLQRFRTYQRWRRSALPASRPRLAGPGRACADAETHPRAPGNRGGQGACAARGDRAPRGDRRGARRRLRSRAVRCACQRRARAMANRARSRHAPTEAGSYEPFTTVSRAYRAEREQPCRFGAVLRRGPGFEGSRAKRATTDAVPLLRRQGSRPGAAAGRSPGRGHDESAVGLRQVAFRIGAELGELRAFRAHLEARAVPIRRIPARCQHVDLFLGSGRHRGRSGYQHPAERWRGERQAARFSRPVRLE